MFCTPSRGHLILNRRLTGYMCDFMVRRYLRTGTQNVMGMGEEKIALHFCRKNRIPYRKMDASTALHVKIKTEKELHNALRAREFDSIERRLEKQIEGTELGFDITAPISQETRREWDHILILAYLEELKSNPNRSPSVTEKVLLRIVGDMTEAEAKESKQLLIELHGSTEYESVKYAICEKLGLQ